MTPVFHPHVINRIITPHYPETSRLPRPRGTGVYNHLLARQNSGGPSEADFVVFNGMMNAEAAISAAALARIITSPLGCIVAYLENCPDGLGTISRRISSKFVANATRMFVTSIRGKR